MNRIPNNIAILEAGGSHDEILYPQFRFLKDARIRTHLIIRNEHLLRIGAPGLADSIFSLETEKNWSGRWKNLISIRKYLLKNEITHLVINTCQGAFIRDLSPLLPRKLNITGISHNPHKLSKSFNQRIINRRVKKYLVLSDNILHRVRSMNPDLFLESFYAIFFPIPLTKKNNDIFTVSIPGAVDLKRRDYYHLLEELKVHPVSPGVKFVFLGRCKNNPALDFRESISSCLSQNQYLFFDEFIPEIEFLERVAQTDLILPLITPALKNFNLYRDYKLTGGINIALGYRIPLLLHKSLESNPDYESAGFFYHEGEMINDLNELSAKKVRIEEKKKRIEKELKFGYSFQQEKYLKFITKPV
jgi:hypothetical protein